MPARAVVDSGPGRTTTIGILIGLAAIVTGFLEYLEPSVVGIDIRLAAKHGIRTTLVWCTFTAKMVVAVLAPMATWSIALCLALDLIGCGLLVQGVVFGTRQVYQQLEEQ